MSTLQIVIEASTLQQIFMYGFLGFIVAMALTPLYTSAAYTGRWWKKPRTKAVTGETATVYQKLHAKKHIRNIPTMAGVVFILATVIVTLAGNLSRSETWLPLAAMVGAGSIGLVDDILNIRGYGRGVAGMKVMMKSALLISAAAVGGWWFFAKLEVDSVNIPFFDQLTIGWLIIPLFVLVVYATANAVNITDGLDGLAGGLAATAFTAYAIIAFIEEKYGIAGFCMTITGALLSYTWFNIHPARFFMGDTGSFALGTALGVVALLTDAVLLLPIIGFVFVIEAGSSLIQILSKKLRGGKKVFAIAPIHHHFEAVGWPETKVTMRFWIIGQVAAFIGIILFILGSDF